MIFLTIIFFSIGFFSGVYKFFPYSELVQLKDITSNQKIDNKHLMDDFIYDVDVKSLIHISDVNELNMKRSNLIKYIWNQNELPKVFPTSINEKISDPNFNDMKNLEKIIQVEYVMDFGINSISYLFIPIEGNNKIIFYHQGHDGHFFEGKKTIEFFLNEGYTVQAFSMPLLGLNDQPIVENEFGPIILRSHDHLKYIASDNLNPVKFFFEPLLASTNYLKENYNFEQYSIIGISGGAWTAMYYSTIDERINHTYAVAGPYPLFLRSNYEQIGDYETELPDLISTVNELETYVISSYGKDRKFVQIFNKYDSCCFGGDYAKTYETNIHRKISKLGSGQYELFIDETHNQHIISDHALDIISSSLRE